MARAHLLDVVEAAYELDRPADAWHHAIVAQAARVFPGATGALGYRFRLTDGMPQLTSEVVGDTDFLAVPDEGHSQLDLAKIYRAYSVPSHAEPTTVFHADPTTGAVPEALQSMWAKLEVSDMFGVYATRPGAECMTIGIAMPARRGFEVRAHDWRPLSRQWTCLARHLEVALAVREAQAAGEVVADFDLHGTGDFSPKAAADRASLVAGAARIEHERRAFGAGNDDSLAVWERVLSGRWSMIRYRRHGGGVRFLAIENPRADVLRRLTPLERQVVEIAASGHANKEIAARTQLHASSVANILTRALRKLGIDRRIHLPILARVLRTQR